jgi:type I restriction-modification system DNA methylase subunit
MPDEATTDTRLATITRQYFQNVRDAQSEAAKKSLFESYLQQAFANDAEALNLINKMLTGTEKTIFNIPVGDRNKTGSADVQYDNTIIEYEFSLNKTLEHAKDQLKEYFAGHYHSEETINFNLIVSDGIQWRIYAPFYENLNSLDTVKPSNLELKEVDAFTLQEDNLEEFFYFIDRYLLRTQPQAPTLENIKRDFGEASGILQKSLHILRTHYDQVYEQEEVKTAYEEWRKFLSIAYGSFDPSREVFLIHTYLSVFSKILAYSVITQDDYIDDQELEGIIKGDIFERQLVNNFIEKDFYHWVSKPGNFEALKPFFNLIRYKISDYDFGRVENDILKGVYQELIDIETRHSLGEYYTPDWLCERMVQEFPLAKGSRILDPACGSGSFLMAAIHRILDRFPQITARELAAQVVGIDIHPLSVQIAKTTILLAFGDKLREEKKPIHLRVYLANTVLIPESHVDLFGNRYSIELDNRKFDIPEKVFDDPAFFDMAINVCDQLAHQTKDREPANEVTLKNTLKKQYRDFGVAPDILYSLHKIYLGLKEAIESNRNSIWKFILQNTYKPFFLQNQFDYIIGNPPWITYSDIYNANYQHQLEALAEDYNVKPDRRANMPHMEIAAIFLSHVTSFFLKKNGQVSFVLPRSFFSADHHENTRVGRAKGFRIQQLWDLEKVKPLFRVPSAVFFAEKSDKERNPLPANGVEGLAFKGVLPNQNIDWAVGKNHLAETTTTFYYSKLERSSAFTPFKLKTEKRHNAYRQAFKQGATIVPRCFYFVQPEEAFPEDLQDRYLYVNTDIENIQAKPPWDKQLSGRVYSEYLYRTALAKNILPFGLINPPLALLPVKKNDQERLKLLSPDQIQEEGDLETAQWFEEAEKLWEANKTEKNKDTTFIAYLDWQKKLTSQNLTQRYLVLYNASAKNANAFIVDRYWFDADFVIDYTAYVYYTDSLEEAYFLAAFFNSDYANEVIKPFQAKGNFGPRHISKKILEIPLNQYDSQNTHHQMLSELGRQCTEKVRQHFNAGSFVYTDEYYNIGSLRTAVRSHLAKELREIDAVLRGMLEKK